VQTDRPEVTDQQNASPSVSDVHSRFRLVVRIEGNVKEIYQTNKPLTGVVDGGVMPAKFLYFSAI